MSQEFYQVDITFTTPVDLTQEVGQEMWRQFDRFHTAGDKTFKVSMIVHSMAPAVAIVSASRILELTLAKHSISRFRMTKVCAALETADTEKVIVR